MHRITAEVWVAKGEIHLVEMPKKRGDHSGIFLHAFNHDNTKDGWRSLQVECMLLVTTVLYCTLRTKPNHGHTQNLNSRRIPVSCKDIHADQPFHRSWDKEHIRPDNPDGQRGIRRLIAKSVLLTSERVWRPSKPGAKQVCANGWISNRFEKRQSSTWQAFLGHDPSRLCSGHWDQAKGMESRSLPKGTMLSWPLKPWSSLRLLIFTRSATLTTMPWLNEIHWRRVLCHLEMTKDPWVTPPHVVRLVSLLKRNWQNVNALKSTCVE